MLIKTFIQSTTLAAVLMAGSNAEAAENAALDSPINPPRLVMHAQPQQTASPAVTQTGCSPPGQGQRDLNCSATAIARLLSVYYGAPVTAKAVLADLWDHGDNESRKQGFSLLDIKRYLKRRGYDADGFDIGLDELEMSGAPAIAIVNINDSSRFVVMKDVRVDAVLLDDPAFGLVQLSRERFLEIWKERILFAIRDGGRLNADKNNRRAEWKKARPESEFKKMFGLASGE